MIKLLLLLLLLISPSTLAFTPSSQKTAIVKEWPLLSPDTADIKEELCLDSAARIRQATVPVDAYISASEQVNITYINWKPDKAASKSDIPVVLLHGFDSSCLEYRRLGSKLASQGIDTYAVDLLGWGFTQLDNVNSFSAQAKVDALTSWIDTIIGKPYCVAGASLGGAAAIELAAAKSGNTKTAGLILIDAQGFVDGIGPMASLPRPLAALGVQVLKSIPLRSSANQMSYFDKKLYATDEAVTVGRLHTLRPGWNDALISFMQSGGFSPSTKIGKITAPALLLWGRQDKILDGNEFVPKFMQALPNVVQMTWMEECGHVPHLEQPEKTAEAIKEFVTTVEQQGKSDSKRVDKKSDKAAPAWLGAAGLGAAGLTAIAADLLPFH